MGNRLDLNLQSRTINRDLARVYYAKVPFLLGSYLVGLLWEADVPEEEWYERLLIDLRTFNQQQLGGAVFDYVLEGTARACIDNQKAGKGFLFDKIRREGLTSITQTLSGYPSKGKPRKGRGGRMAA